jgi:hypothetical protein
MTKRGAVAVLASIAAAAAFGLRTGNIRWTRNLLASKILHGGGETRDEEIERRLCAVEIHLQQLPPERVS